MLGCLRGAHMGQHPVARTEAVEFKQDGAGVRITAAYDDGGKSVFIADSDLRLHSNSSLESDLSHCLVLALRSSARSLNRSKERVENPYSRSTSDFRLTQN